MNRNLHLVAAGLCLTLSFAFRGPLKGQQPEKKEVKPVRSSTKRDINCDHASERDWQSVRSLFYQPNNTLYIADWQYCLSNPTQQRVRIADADGRRVFFHYENDEVLRLEMLDLLEDHVPQLLVLTGGAGTGDDIDWHVIGESGGKLTEWKRPDYDTSAEKLLSLTRISAARTGIFTCRETILFWHGESTGKVKETAAQAEEGFSFVSGPLRIRLNSSVSSGSANKNTHAGAISPFARSVASTDSGRVTPDSSLTPSAPGPLVYWAGPVQAKRRDRSELPTTRPEGSLTGVY